jgi:plasmid stabilization system protein ParE
MAASNFRVVFTHSAFADIEEIVEYWRHQGDTERGEQYAHDLPTEAIRRLGDARTARSGRHLVKTSFPETRELPVFKRSYRILYRIRESESTVEVLRFWHSHRDEPFRDA